MENLQDCLCSYWSAFNVLQLLNFLYTVLLGIAETGPFIVQCTVAFIDYMAAICTHPFSCLSDDITMHAFEKSLSKSDFCTCDWYEQSVRGLGFWKHACMPICTELYRCLFHTTRASLYVTITSCFDDACNMMDGNMGMILELAVK